MQFQHTRIRFTEETNSVPVVPSNATLLELAEVFASYLCAFVLVRHDDGQLAGVVSLADFQESIRSTSETDSDPIWHSRTVSSILQVVLKEVPRNAPANDDARVTNRDPDLDCVSVTEHGELVAVLTNNDVLFSWNRLEPTLARVAIDELTQLPNRTHFERRLAEEWERATRQKHSIGVILIDIDHFKQINDEYGHLQGDTVLRSVAECCQRQLRSYDLVARFAGDEFIAMTSGCGTDDFETPIHRLQTAIRELSLEIDGAIITPTLSIGAALTTEVRDELQPAQLIEAADQCLYQAKRRGRNQGFRTLLNADGSIARAKEVRLFEHLEATKG